MLNFSFPNSMSIQVSQHHNSNSLSHTKLENSSVDESLAALNAHASEAAQLLKALANENRLMILCSLASKELNVTELNDRLQLSQSALSQHLAWLRREDLVGTRRDAQTIYYRLSGDKANQVIDVLKNIYCPDLS